MTLERREVGEILGKFDIFKISVERQALVYKTPIEKPLVFLV